MRRFHRGFTLMESALVLALIMILLLATSVNFSGSQTLATSRQAQVTAQDALSTEINYAASNSTNSFTASAQTLQSHDPDITFVSGATSSTTDQTASVAVATSTAACPGQCVAIAVDAPPTGQAGAITTNTCWYVLDDVAAPLSEIPMLYAYSTAATTTNCTGAQGLTLAALPASTSPGQTFSQPYNAAFG